MPATNEYARPEYTFAAVENHLMFSTDKTLDRPHWHEPGTHHAAALAGYVTGKPVFMTEGNALWRRYWGEKLGTTQDDLRQAAWACATAASSFTWCGHTSLPLTVRGPGGLPFFGTDNPYTLSAQAIDVLGDVMNRELVFYRMTPQDALLSGHDKQNVFCLAEPSHQYLVFASAGKPFSLNLAAGNYTANAWLDVKSGTQTKLSAITLTASKVSAFTPPNTQTDWALLIRESTP
ncbi:MAG: putative collagen-binding domain-containing protein [Polyangiaceae bacterium]